MFQIHFKLCDVGQSLAMFNRIEFELGVWFHAGWTYYNDVTTVYKDGCLVKKKTTWLNDGSPPPNEDGVLFGSQSNINIDLELDEFYIWEAKKPAIVFNVLYEKAA